MDRDDRVGAGGEGRVVGRLEVARRRGGRRREGCVGRRHPHPELVDRHVDAGLVALRAEVDDERDDRDAGAARQLGREIGRRVRDDRDVTHGAPPGGGVVPGTLGASASARMIRAGRASGTLPGVDRSLQAVLSRHVHAALQHRPHRGDARLLPGRPGQFHGGPSIDAKVGVFPASFYLAELVLSPLFGILSDRWGHHKVMLYGPAFGAIAVVMTAFTSTSSSWAGRASSRAPARRPRSPRSSATSPS